MNDVTQGVWVPVEPTDVVFTMREEGRVVVQTSRERNSGAIVCLRTGGWMKRVSPLIYVDPALIAQYRRQKYYEMGSQLMST